MMKTGMLLGGEAKGRREEAGRSLKMRASLGGWQGAGDSSRCRKISKGLSLVRVKVQR